VGKNVPAFIISEEESVEKLNKEIAKEKIPPVRNKLDEELKHVVFGPGSNKKVRELNIYMISIIFILSLFYSPPSGLFPRVPCAFCLWTPASRPERYRSIAL
jgi:hypothetical protein